MRKVVRVLVIGSALGAAAFGQAFSFGFGPSAVGARPALAFVSGTVKDDLGQPLAGAVVALLEAAFNGREVKSVKTDIEGKFVAAVLPGSYRLRAAAEGFRPALTRVLLDRAAKVSYDFSLKRDDTLVEKRGDRDDYRWVGRSVPRHVLHFDPTQPAETPAQVDSPQEGNVDFRPSFRGMMQFVAASSLTGRNREGLGFYGANFAVSGSFSNSFEMALIGQRGWGTLAPQRLEAIATLRPSSSHQITASVGYGQVPFVNRVLLESEVLAGGVGVPGAMANGIQPHHAGGTLEQLSVSAVGEWQVFQPLLVIYGFDYAKFIGSSTRRHESILPRLAVQFAPSSRWRVNGAMTPGSGQSRQGLESFTSEDIQVSFDARAPEVAVGDYPVLDRSRRLEFGTERIFGDGRASLEASAFYDVVSGHGVGVLTLPLEVSPETQATFAQMANHVEAMNGGARGVRVMYAKRVNDYLTASAGYSFGRGSQMSRTYLNDLRPSNIFRNGFFQVATAKFDLDFSQHTGTRISTVVRLSPDAVIFAIDPFAGRMSVYDPNINVYVTQDLPSLGLPIRWQALVDIRNLLNQMNGVDDGTVQLVSARSFRTIRGGVALRW